MAFDAGPENEPVTSINVTPLVDVVLVLLVVLMVAASGAISEALPLDLPSASTGSSTESSLLRIGIAADGSLSVDGQLADLATVCHAAERATAQGGDARAAIAADGAARHERVVEVLDTLRSGGISRLAFQVSPRDR